MPPSAEPPPPSADAPHALAARGDALRRGGDLAAARACYEAALAGGDALAEATALAGLGHLAAAAGDSEAAAAHFARAASAFEALALPARAVEVEANAACVRYAQGDAAGAAAAFERTLARRLALGDARGAALDRTNLAHCRLALGEPARALADYEAAAEAALAALDLAGAAAAHEGAGLALFALGRPLDARAALARALDVTERAARAEASGPGDPAAVGLARLALADADYQAGDLARAVAGYEAALAEVGPRLAPLEAARRLVNLGGMRYAAGDVAPALAAFDEAQARLDPLLPEAAPGAPLALPLDVALVLTHLRSNRGTARLAAGRFDEARADLAAAAAGYAALGEVRREAEARSRLSDLARYAGDLPGAVAHHREVVALEAAHGFHLDEAGGLLYAPIEDPGLAIAEATGADPALRRPPVVPFEVHVDPALAAARPVVLFAPPVVGHFGPLFPRGATCVASFLQAHGVPAVVVPLSHFVDPYAGASRAQAQLRAAVHGALAAYHPRAVGLSVTFSYLYPKGLELARLVREVDREVPVLIGGPHVTYWDRECLAEAPEVDVVVRGEGEWTALELVRALERGDDLGRVAGITWRAPDGTVHRNERRALGDVRELPPVDFALLPRDFARRMEVTGLTSRGCKFRCTFCHEFRYWGAVVRDHPPARLVDELERLGREHGNAMRGIDDSMLSMLEPSFFELCRRLGESPWRPQGFSLLTRIDTITADGLAAMQAAGVTAMSVGLESASPRVLAKMNKGYKLEDVRATLELVRDAGVGLAAFFIVGHPGDSPAEHAVTLEFVDRLFEDELVGWIDLSIYTPYPGTPAFTNPAAFGVEVLSRDWSKWRRSNRPIAQLREFSASEIYLGYLQTLEVQARHHARKRARATAAPAAQALHPGLRA